MTEEETFIEELPCKLTNSELLERGDRAARLNKQAADLDEESKQARKVAQQKVAQLKAEGGALLEAVRTRQERRPVQCIQRDNTTTGRREKVRTDTGEVFWSRPLTGQELDAANQMPMRFPETGGRERVRKPAYPRAIPELADAIEEHLAEHDEDGVVPDSEPAPSMSSEATGNLPGKIELPQSEPPPPAGDVDDEELFADGE